MLVEFSDIELAVIGMAASAAGFTSNRADRQMPEAMVDELRSAHPVLCALCDRVTKICEDRAAVILAQHDLAREAGKPE